MKWTLSEGSFRAELAEAEKMEVVMVHGKQKRDNPKRPFTTHRLKTSLVYCHF